MTASHVPQIRLYQDWLAQHRGLRFDRYDDLWHWSTTEIEAFWESIWDYFDLQSPTPYRAVLRERVMPGARWFEGAQVNYVQQVFRHVAPAQAAGFAAVISRNERGEHRELSWPQLRHQVAALALHLRAQGVQPGDRVVAYLPNIPEAMVAFLAVVSLGAVWSICAPDMGMNAVLDRFRQIEPRVLIACDGVRHGGRDHDRCEVVAQLRAALPSVEHLIIHRNLGVDETALAALTPFTPWTQALACDEAAAAAFEPVWLPFDHPLWIVYSSGTTGLPKPIVHGHGGMVIVALALKTLHNDIGCSYQPHSWGERYHWYSSTGWIMAAAAGRSHRREHLSHAAPTHLQPAGVGPRQRRRLVGRQPREQGNTRHTRTQGPACTHIDGQHLDRVRAEVAANAHRIRAVLDTQKHGVAQLRRKIRQVRLGHRANRQPPRTRQPQQGDFMADAVASSGRVLFHRGFFHQHLEQPVRGRRGQAGHLRHVGQTHAAILSGRHQPQHRKCAAHTLCAFSNTRRVLVLAGHCVQPSMTVLAVWCSGRKVVTAPIVA